MPPTLLPLPREMEGLHRDSSPGDRPSFKSRLHEWQKIKAPVTILQWIVNSVPLPLHNVPRLQVLQNHHLDDLQAAFLDEEIARLLREKAIRLLGSEEKAMISPLGVVTKKNSKFQPIVDMRFINEFFNVPKFKFEGLNELATMVKEGDWSATIDFWDGFQHVKVHPNHQHLLGFKWRGTCYAFTVLPFGLAASPWAFTRFVRTTVTHLRQLGMRVLAYMDDLFIMGSSFADIFFISTTSAGSGRSHSPPTHTSLSQPWPTSLKWPHAQHNNQPPP